jgi:hypothetical protein
MATNEAIYSSSQLGQHYVSRRDSDCDRFGFNPALSGVFCFLSPSVGRSLFRRKAFFIESARALLEKKSAEGQVLTEKVFKRWVNAELKFSPTFESVEWSDVEFPIDFGTAPADAIISKKGLRAVGRARKPEYYACEHLITGYPKIWNSAVRFLQSQKLYADLAIEKLPLIRNRLQEETQKRLPHLARLEALGNSEVGYNFNLLFLKLLEHRLSPDQPPPTKEPLEERLKESLRKMIQSPRSHLANTPWEFTVKTGHSQKGIFYNELILRTPDPDDAERLIESMCVTLLDSDVQKHFLALRLPLTDARAMLRYFKEGLLELINSVELKGPFKGTCANCKEWE